ncbi:MAG TPA: MFS transporter [Thermogutta sp.]|nr:MFS transporter [Thermogutta sp.]
MTPKSWWNRTILGAGITSAFGDLCYEMGNVVLPGLLSALGIPAALLGVMEGVADGLASFTKLVAGYIGDRFGHRKTLVVAGYALNTIGQGFMAIATGFWLIALGRILAWFGRGIRGPLRDEIMTAAVPPEQRGRAFGFHRAADTFGAILGPAIGTGLVAWLGSSLATVSPTMPFRSVLVISMIPGALAVLSFAVLVHDPGGGGKPKLRFWGAMRSMPSSFRHYLVAVGIYGSGDFAPTLLILAATQTLSPSYGVTMAGALAGSLYVLRNTVQTLVSYPVGWLSDRLGARRVLVGGYVLGTLSCVLLAIIFALGYWNILPLAAVFILSGICAAVQETVEPVVTAALVPAEIRATCYGVLGAVNGVGDLISSFFVGLIWTLVAPQWAFLAAGGTLLMGTALLAALKNHGADSA